VCHVDRMPPCLGEYHAVHVGAGVKDTFYFSCLRGAALMEKCHVVRDVVCILCGGCGGTPPHPHEKIIMLKTNK